MISLFFSQMNHFIQWTWTSEFISNIFKFQISFEQLNEITWHESNKGDLSCIKYYIKRYPVKKTKIWAFEWTEYMGHTFVEWVEWDETRNNLFNVCMNVEIDIMYTVILILSNVLCIQILQKCFSSVEILMESIQLWSNLLLWSLFIVIVNCNREE